MTEAIVQAVDDEEQSHLGRDRSALQRILIVAADQGDVRELGGSGFAEMRDQDDRHLALLRDAQDLEDLARCAGVREEQNHVLRGGERCAHDLHVRVRDVDELGADRREAGPGLHRHDHTAALPEAIDLTGVVQQVDGLLVCGNVHLFDCRIQGEDVGVAQLAARRLERVTGCDRVGRIDDVAEFIRVDGFGERKL